jgi:hypothetical protein
MPWHFGRYIFHHFGKLCEDKSGNPVREQIHFGCAVLEEFLLGTLEKLFCCGWNGLCKNKNKVLFRASLIECINMEGGNNMINVFCFFSEPTSP